jgi:hypothetical protein
MAGRRARADHEGEPRGTPAGICHRERPVGALRLSSQSRRSCTAAASSRRASSLFLARAGSRRVSFPCLSTAATIQTQPRRAASASILEAKLHGAPCGYQVEGAARGPRLVHQIEAHFRESRGDRPFGVVSDQGHGQNRAAASAATTRRCGRT